MFRFPKLRLQLTRLLRPGRETDVEIFGAPLRISTRHEIGLWRAATIAEENMIFRDEAASLSDLAFLLRPATSSLMWAQMSGSTAPPFRLDQTDAK